MAETNIEWCRTTRPDGTSHTGWTFNPWRGCTKVSPGCKFCYAETFSARNPAVLGEWGPQGKRVIAAPANWRDPLRWNAEARRLEQQTYQQTGQPAPYRPRIFFSLGDPWEDNPQVRPARLQLLQLIRQTPYVDWILITKRPELIQILLFESLQDATRAPRTESNQDLKFWLDAWLSEIAPHNVWLGASVENQDYLRQRLDALLSTAAVRRLLSCEPLLSALDFTGLDTTGLHWVIAGGESGHQKQNVRPLHPAWAEDLRRTCHARGLAFFFKQKGAYTDEDVNGQLFAHGQRHLPPGVIQLDLAGNMHPAQPRLPGAALLRRVGKAAAGRSLGIGHYSESPTSAPLPPEFLFFSNPHAHLPPAIPPLT